MLNLRRQPKQASYEWSCTHRRASRGDTPVAAAAGSALVASVADDFIVIGKFAPDVTTTTASGRDGRRLLLPLPGLT